MENWGFVYNHVTAKAATVLEFLIHGDGYLPLMFHSIDQNDNLDQSPHRHSNTHNFLPTIESWCSNTIRSIPNSWLSLRHGSTQKSFIELISGARIAAWTVHWTCSWIFREDQLWGAMYAILGTGRECWNTRIMLKKNANGNWARMRCGFSGLRLDEQGLWIPRRSEWLICWCRNQAWQSLVRIQCIDKQKMDTSAAVALVERLSCRPWLLCWFRSHQAWRAWKWHRHLLTIQDSTGLKEGRREKFNLFYSLSTRCFVEPTRTPVISHICEISAGYISSIVLVFGWPRRIPRHGFSRFSGDYRLSSVHWVRGHRYSARRPQWETPTRARIVQYQQNRYQPLITVCR